MFRPAPAEPEPAPAAEPVPVSRAVRAPEPAPYPETAPAPAPKPKIRPEPVRAPKSDLSDSINIHSNFCKLDNDVSDYLLQKLSASAQAVYLRLYRQSFGWNRNWAAESLPKLVEFCNLSLQTVRKAI
jgi:hypothetical protein